VARISGFKTLGEVLSEIPDLQGPPGPLIPACPDADGDAWADCVSNPTCNPYGHPCGDCDDSDATVNPGANEANPNRNKRDDKDNDCNGFVDDFDESEKGTNP